MTAFIWIAIALCVSQSAMFSGLNLAFFSLSRLRLGMEARKGSPEALRVLSLRKDSNLLLTTILWGNVAANVLLALLSNSVLAGLVAFLFSTFVITFFGEIVPQAYFSRHALKMASALVPVMKLYRILLYPVAKPSAMVLEAWLGPESIEYFKERDLAELIRFHADSPKADEIDRLEGRGAINFLAIDDVKVGEEGEEIDPASILALRFEGEQPVFPRFSASGSDPFLQALDRSGKKWVVLTDEEEEPRLVLNADGFLRDILLGDGSASPLSRCHRPIIVRDEGTQLGQTIPKLTVAPNRPEDDVVDDDIIVVWSNGRRIITGADLLGRLLRGIVNKTEPASPAAAKS